MDEQGYYFQSDSQQVISPVDEVITPDDIMLAEDTIMDGDPYQTVTLVPSDVDGEVSYYLIVQQEVNNEIDNHSTVYDFNENEELESGNQNSETVHDEEEKIKIVPVQKRHSSTKTHMCSYCNYTTSKKYLLSRHMKSHSEERPHKCTICSAAFKTLPSLQNHVNTHTGTKPHKCRFCNSAFTTSGELVRHVRYRHTHEKPHKCTECNYASVELSKLKRHARCHTGERPYQCIYCTYASQDTFKLKRHMRIHTGEKPYECEYCHVSFTQSNSLKTHKLTHNVGEKLVYHCQLCPTTCRRKTDLRNHVQKLHISDKPIKCRRCDKSFPDRYHLKIHVKTHVGEKCFKCEYCPYASASLQHLNSHLFVHTNEKTFSCDICVQSFRQKQLLKRHQNIYHNPDYVPPLPKEKSLKCQECDKYFRHKGNLIRHLATHDPDSDIHQKSLSLRTGRKRKLQIENTETLENTQNIVFENETVIDTQVNSDSLPHYVIFEVIHDPEGNSNEQVIGDFDEDSNKPNQNHDDQFYTKKTTTENDAANCFTFDASVDEADEDLR